LKGEVSSPLKLTKSKKFKTGFGILQGFIVIDRCLVPVNQAEDSFLKRWLKAVIRLKHLLVAIIKRHPLVPANSKESLDVTKRLLKADSIILLKLRIVYQQYLVRTDYIDQTPRSFEVD